MEQKFLRHFYIGLLAILVVTAAIVILFDPFYHYHDSVFGLKHVLEDRDYQVAGTIDHFTYDAILLGTSTAENNNLGQFRENFGCEPIKAIRAGGSNADFLTYLDRAYKKRQIRKVFYYIDYIALEGDLKPTFDRMDTDFITNANPFDDVKYLLNKDILLKNIPLQFVYTYGLSYDEDNPYSWYQSKTFSTAAITGRYSPREEFLSTTFNETTYQNFTTNIGLLSERIQKHPETEYYVVFSPISILWWDEAYRAGEIDQKIRETQEFVKAMDAFENVKIYYFQNDRDLAANLDHYMDSVHFSYEVNCEICDRVARDENRITAANCEALTQDLYQMVEEFSRGGILEYYADALTQ